MPLTAVYLYLLNRYLDNLEICKETCGHDSCCISDEERNEEVEKDEENMY